MSQISLSHREDYERLFRAGVACATVCTKWWSYLFVEVVWTQYRYRTHNGVNANLELVDKFCYLGDMLSVDGDADAAVKTRIRIGWNKSRQLVQLLTNKDIFCVHFWKGGVWRLVVTYCTFWWVHNCLSTHCPLPTVQLLPWRWQDV